MYQYFNQGLISWFEN